MIQRSSFRRSRTYFHLSLKFSIRVQGPEDLEHLWTELAQRLRQHKFIQIHSCVLLKNHFHLLGSVNETYFGFLKECLAHEFRDWVCEATAEALYLRPIQSLAEYREVYRYIYRNPVEARLSHFVQDYEFSTLSEILGFKQKHFFVNDNMGLVSNPIRILKWLESKELFLH